MARKPNATFGPDRLDVLVGRAKAAWTHKSKWDNLIRECYRFGLPAVDPWGTSAGGDAWNAPSEVGTSRRDDVMDSTLEQSNLKLIASIKEDFFPHGTTWAFLEPRPGLSESQKIIMRPVLQQINAAISDVVHASNFDIEIGKTGQDRTTAGNGYLAPSWDEDNENEPLGFHCISQADVAVECDSKGKPTAYFVKAQMPWEEAEAIYGIKAIPENIDRSKERTAKVWRIHYKRQDKFRWESYHILESEDGSSGSPTMLKDVEMNGLDECPILRWVWSQSPKEKYGRGPVMAALADFLTLNTAKRLILTQAGFDALNLYKTTPGAIADEYNVIPEPGEVLVVPRMDQFERVDTGNGQASTQIVIDDLRRDVRKQMFDPDLPESLEQGNPATATEIRARLREHRRNHAVAAAHTAEFASEIITWVKAKMTKRSDARIKKGGLDIKTSPTQDPFQLAKELPASYVRLDSPLIDSQEFIDLDRLLEAIEMAHTVNPKEIGPFRLVAKETDIIRAIFEKNRVSAALYTTKEEEVENAKGLARMAEQQVEGGGQGGPPALTQPPGAPNV